MPVWSKPSEERAYIILTSQLDRVWKRESLKDDSLTLNIFLTLGKWTEHKAATYTDTLTQQKTVQSTKHTQQ